MSFFTLYSQSTVTAQVHQSVQGELQGESQGELQGESQGESHMESQTGQTVRVANICFQNKLQWQMT